VKFVTSHPLRMTFVFILYFAIFLCPVVAHEDELMGEWVVRQIYLENCAACHGYDRTGFIGAELTPSNLDGLSEAALRSLISHGIEETLMPAWSCRFTIEQLRGLSYYLKETPPEIQKVIWSRSKGSLEVADAVRWWNDPKRIHKGQTLFMEYCMGCHHPKYEAFAPTYGDVARKRHIRAIVGQIKFPYSSSRILGYLEQGMPKFELTDDEIKSLGAYVYSCRNLTNEE
jgi:mono/diheme cytochrome c family protein